MITKLQITGKLHCHRKCDFQLSKRKLGYRTLLPLTAPIEFVSHVSYSLLLIGIHVIAPFTRLATKHPNWPVSPTLGPIFVKVCTVLPMSNVQNRVKILPKSLTV